MKGKGAMDKQVIEGFSNFPDKEESENDEESEMRKLIIKQNRKNKKSGGFQSMGLSRSVYRAILVKGYKVPTPIQRKAIPIIMENLDVVAMARTGSGKTAAFLIPLLEKLKAKSAKSGARALILSPTRELALQTLKFTKELGKFCGLQSLAILGGDSMEDQFEALHHNPDVIIATPGRLLHVLVEMDLKLKFVEYIVFDEADRLFEMGFQEQLLEIINRLPDNRQTVMFSATLPKLLVDFAKAGLNNPTLIRLDVDSKLSSNLKLSYFTCRADDKPAVILHILHNIVNTQDQTVIFAATKHHVDYLKDIISKAGLLCTYTYSSLDPTARKINVAKFQSKQCNILVVTDVAARGIDIPLLDNVINYNFPAKSKLFVHRVGRVARAGRKGHAYSLVAPDERPYLLDLHLFLGKPVTLVAANDSSDADGVIGSVPQQIIDDEGDILQHWHDESADLMGMKCVCNNAYKMYLKSRAAASSESIKRSKQLFNDIKIPCHPLFKGAKDNHKVENERQKIVDQIKEFKSKTTVFEVSSSGKSSRKVRRSEAFSVMMRKRDHHGDVIENRRLKKLNKSGGTGSDDIRKHDDMEMSNEIQLKEVFITTPGTKNKSNSFKNDEFYIPYKAADHHTEEGLGVTNASKFEHDARSAVLDLIGDDDRTMQKNNAFMKWDKKRKRYVNEAGVEMKKKKIKTESGNWISATYKSDRYKNWKTKQKADEEAGDDDEESGDDRKTSMFPRTKFRGGKKRGGGGGSKGAKTGEKFMSKRKKPPKHELKSNEQILKSRHTKEKLQSLNRRQNKQKKRSSKRKS